MAAGAGGSIDEGISYSKKLAEELPDKAIPKQPGSDTTQVATTIGSYKTAANNLKKSLKDGSTVLDYGSGLGLGTDAMKEVLGTKFNIENYEPSPEKAQVQPTYKESDKIKKRYDSIVSLNVVNVLEKDIRDMVVSHIGQLLKPGGKAIIGSRKFKGDIDNTKNFRPASEKGAIWVNKSGGEVFQKGFDGKELLNYVKDVLGKGYNVRKLSGVGANGVLIEKLSSDKLPSGLKGSSEGISYSIKVPSKGTTSKPHEMEVSGRTPSSKRASPKEGILVSDLEGMMNDPNHAKRVIESIRPKEDGTYASLGGVKLSTDPKVAIQQVIKHYADNIKWLYDKYPKQWRDRAENWYEGANRISKDLAELHGLSDAQTSGIVAVLSPSTDWLHNVEQAKQILDIIKNPEDKKWTPSIEDFQKAKIKGYKQKVEDSSSKGKKPIPSHVKFLKAAQNIAGKDLKQLSDPYEKAVWLRAYAETHKGLSYKTLSPEGEVTGTKMIESGKREESMRWNTYDNIAKAVSILTDGSKENISKQLGKNHKIRNFYNNILNPNSELGHVTADTHAVAGASLQPLGSTNYEIKQNFGGTSSALTGINGTYPIVHEAYKLAAKNAGILPRKMQSAVWEAVKSMFSNKSAKVKAEVASIWKEHAKGKLTLSQARDKILETASPGGFKAPDWATTAKTPRK